MLALLCPTLPFPHSDPRPIAERSNHLPPSAPGAQMQPESRRGHRQCCHRMCLGPLLCSLPAPRVLGKIVSECWCGVGGHVTSYPSARPSPVSHPNFVSSEAAYGSPGRPQHLRLLWGHSATHFVGLLRVRLPAWNVSSARAGTSVSFTKGSPEGAQGSVRRTENLCKPLNGREREAVTGRAWWVAPCGVQ